VKLSDFGLEKYASEDDRIESEREYSQIYAAPEFVATGISILQ
jgi:hypothetical protein